MFDILQIGTSAFEGYTKNHFWFSCPLRPICLQLPSYYIFLRSLGTAAVIKVRFDHVVEVIGIVKKAQALDSLQHREQQWYAVVCKKSPFLVNL